MRRRLAPLLLMFAVSSAAGLHAQSPATTPATPLPAANPPEQVFIKPATIDNSLEVTGDPVAAKEVNTRMEVGVLVDGKGPFRFFVDSGADRSVIGLRTGPVGWGNERQATPGCARSAPA